jgi:hypothetical protein
MLLMSSSGGTATRTSGVVRVLSDEVLRFRGRGSGGGAFTAGEQKTCTTTNDDVPATLTVIKHVVNDNGRSKTAGDFTLTTTGITASGGNSFSGAESGVSKTLLSVGPRRSRVRRCDVVSACELEDRVGRG